MRSKTNFQYFKHGFKNGIPIFLGYVAVSFTFGITAKSGGIDSWAAVLMSALNFTSAGQFAALDIITSGASYMEMALTQLIINLRYSLMSSSISQRMSERMPAFHRFIISFGMTDEIFGVDSSYTETNIPPAFCYGVMASAQPGWVLGTLLGVISGSLLPPRILSALGIALYGMFIAIIVPPARKNRVLGGIILLSMVASLVFTVAPVLREISSGFRIIILTVAIASAAAWLFPVPSEEVSQ